MNEPGAAKASALINNLMLKRALQLLSMAIGTQPLIIGQVLWIFVQKKSNFLMFQKVSYFNFITFFST